MDFGVAPCLMIVAQETPTPVLTPRDGLVGGVVVVAVLVLIPFYEKWKKFRMEDSERQAKENAEAKKAERDDRAVTFAQLNGLYEMQTKNLAQAVADSRKLTDELVVEKLKNRDLENRVANLTEDLAEARGTKAGG